VKFPEVKTTFEMVWAEHICIESTSLNFCWEGKFTVSEDGSVMRA